MRIEPLGDCAYILRGLEAPAHQVAAWLNANPPPGMIEAIASYDTVGLYTAIDFDPATIKTAIHPKSEIRNPKSHEIPVCYEIGEDLAEMAQRLNLSAQELASAHASAEYVCFAVGFCPGFA